MDAGAAPTTRSVQGNPAGPVAPFFRVAGFPNQPELRQACAEADAGPEPEDAPMLPAGRCMIPQMRRHTDPVVGHQGALRLVHVAQDVGVERAER